MYYTQMHYGIRRLLEEDLQVDGTDFNPSMYTKPLALLQKAMFCINR